MTTAVLAGFFVVTGVGLMTITAIGLLRLPDVYSRMHAASKTTSLGLTFTFVGAAILHGTAEAGVKLGLAALFLLLTQPVAVHLLSRAAHRVRVPLWEGTLWDELAERYPDE